MLLANSVAQAIIIISLVGASGSRRAPSGSASLAHATVYPLVMLLRVVSAQLLIHLGLT